MFVYDISIYKILCNSNIIDSNYTIANMKLKYILPGCVATHIAAVTSCFILKILAAIRELNVSAFASGFFQETNLQPPNF